MKKLYPLLAILVLAFALRLYKIDNPIADWHSFRQADTASVTREYVKHGINFLKPTYHDLSNIQSGKENPNGYRMVELPILNAFTAFIITTFNLETQEVLVGRLVSVFFSLITLASIYFLGLKLSGRLTAIASALAFAVLPYSVFYSRVILPEPALIALSTLSLTLFIYRFNLFSALVFSLALLVKPYAIFLLPVYLAIHFWQKKSDRSLLSLPLFLLAGLPLYLWRQYITKFPEGIPASDWLFNKDNIRFKGAFFHWLFDVRISNLILGVGGVLPYLLGLVAKGRDQFVYLTWAVCLLAYLVVFAGGNVQHDYYQVFLLPLICLAVGRGISFLWKLVPEYLSKPVFFILVTGLTLFSLFVSWYTVRGYYQINNWPIVEAGRIADQSIPAEAKVIAPYFGDTAFLFQTNRTGWPIGYYIEDKIKMGATHYVTVVYDDEARELERKYQTIAKTDLYLLLDLTKPL